jgi:hypothetical protein
MNHWKHDLTNWPMAGLCLTLWLGATEVVPAELTIAEKGQSRYVIVLPKEAIPAEQYAAEELQRYLERIGGAHLPIVMDDTAPGSHEILLGHNARLQTGTPGSSRATQQSNAAPAKTASPSARWAIIS